MTPHPRLLTVPAAADYLGGIHTSTLRRMAADDVFPSVMIGGRRMFDRADLDAYIDAHKTPAAGSALASAEEV